MKKYYLMKNGREEGPFTLQELRNKNLSLSSLVGNNSLHDCRFAGTIPELQPLFATPEQRNLQLNRTKVLIGIILLVITFTAILLLFLNSKL